MKTTTLERQELVKQALKRAVSYPEYRVLVADHAKKFTSTGADQSEALSNYTILNDKRMNRWDKTLRLSPAVEDRLAAFTKPLNWLVMTESWCGDASPALPVMFKMAESAPGINLRIVLRDENPQLMDAFLTDGNRSIPKLIFQEPESGKILADWGPRSIEATRLVEEEKRTAGVLSASFKESLQLWYNKDKGQAVASDLLGILDAISFNPETQS